MNKEDFITLLENELEELDNALMDDSQRGYQVEGFYEAYTSPSVTACSNILYATTDEYIEGSDDRRKFDPTGTNLMITLIGESHSLDGPVYIVSLVHMDSMTENKILLSSQEEVINYAIVKWFNVFYDKDKHYEWYYKDGEYSEDIIND